ncbi:hypothetical protein B2J77_09050 [Pseudomonas parafulva]|uniref:Uncharacterized protein n=1 Tax=Pseudomonas parafulva TaxID=157782 RepID=A0ABM6J1R1_9PSED|nr:hypothetical protein B2J77_09050 [Pseudomonas parafulva]
MISRLALSPRPASEICSLSGPGRSPGIALPASVEACAPLGCRSIAAHLIAPEPCGDGGLLCLQARRSWLLKSDRLESLCSPWLVTA